MKTKLIAIVSIALALVVATLGGPAFAQDNKSENIGAGFSARTALSCRTHRMSTSSARYTEFVPTRAVNSPTVWSRTGGLPEDNEGIFVVFMPADLNVENTVRQFCLTEDPRYASRR
jgi:hypothetical protein